MAHEHEGLLAPFLCSTQEASTTKGDGACTTTNKSGENTTSRRSRVDVHPSKMYLDNDPSAPNSRLHRRNLG